MDKKAFNPEEFPKITVLFIPLIMKKSLLKSFFGKVWIEATRRKFILKYYLDIQNQVFKLVKAFFFVWAELLKFRALNLNRYNGNEFTLPT